MIRAPAVVLAALVLLLGACGGSTFPASKSLSEGPPLRPFAEQAPAPPAAKDSPQAFPWKTQKFQPPAERRLANGIRVVLAPRRDFPTATVLFVLDRGASSAPSGVASLYARALWGDSDAYDFDEAASYIHYVGASVQPAVTDDAVLLQVSALAPLLPSALSRVAPMFVTPKFDSKSLDRARASFTNDNSDAPARIARRTLRASLYPSPHPYGKPASLVFADDVAGLKRDALASFREMFVTTERIHVIATGDFDPDALVRTLDRLLAKVPQKAASSVPAFPEVASTCGGGITIVDRPGSVQSSIAIGWPAVTAAHADRAALEVMTAATGGWLSSRLNLTVRKELGASYGVHATLNALRDGGTLELTSAVETSRTADALAGIIRETERLRTEALSADELDTAKTKSLLGEDPSSSRSLAYRLAHSAAEGLSAAHVVQHVARVDALSSDDVKSVAEKWLPPSKRCIVVVGDAAKIAPAITSLGIGRVELTRAPHR